MMSFTFGIPLRSRVTAKDWGQVCRLFEATLHSVLRQTDENFRVIIACHELPEVVGLSDPRVLIVQTPFPPPSALPEQMTDKGRKRRLIGATLRALDGGYLMLLDADDLVSNRLVAFARRDAHPHGYILREGYEFDASSQRIRVAPRFNRLCGSSAIIRFDADELPPSVNEEDISYFSRFSNHVHWEAVAAAAARALKPLPFPGAVYVMNNGENHSAQTNNIGWKRRLLRRFMRGTTPSPTNISEFGLLLKG
jgi:hypothetical protein